MFKIIKSYLLILLKDSVKIHAYSPIGEIPGVIPVINLDPKVAMINRARVS